MPTRSQMTGEQIAAAYDAMLALLKAELIEMAKDFGAIEHGSEDEHIMVAKLELMERLAQAGGVYLYGH